MIRIERTCRSLGATERFATDLAAVLRPGDVVRLQGDMGAGKTTLVRAVASSLGVHPDAVTSPTYALMNVYETAAGVPIAHLDCYRLNSGDELDALGWDQITDGRTIVLVEWAERVADAIGPDTPRIEIRPTGDESRHFTLTLPDAWEDRSGFPGLETPPDTTCPITGRPVPGDSPTWPFFDERARLADLHGWITEKYTISRPVSERDLDQSE